MKIVNCYHCTMPNWSAVMQRDDYGDLICPDCWDDAEELMPAGHRAEFWLERKINNMPGWALLLTGLSCWLFAAWYAAQIVAELIG